MPDSASHCSALSHRPLAGMQVNLKLFAPEPNRRRTVLLFVIRDKSKTPLSKLVEVLSEDVHKMWDTISKPPQYADSKIDDFFEVGVGGRWIQGDMDSAMLLSLQRAGMLSAMVVSVSFAGQGMAIAVVAVLSKLAPASGQAHPRPCWCLAFVLTSTDSTAQPHTAKPPAGVAGVRNGCQQLRGWLLVVTFMLAHHGGVLCPSAPVSAC